MTFFCLHDWQEVYNHSPRVVQECSKCGKKRSSTYDMTYGETVWEMGDFRGIEWTGGNESWDQIYDKYRGRLTAPNTKGVFTLDGKDVREGEFV